MKTLLFVIATIFLFSCVYPTAKVKLTDESVCVDRNGKHFTQIEQIDFLTFDGVDFITQEKDTIFIEMNSGNNYFLAHSEFLKAMDDTTRFITSLK